MVDYKTDQGIYGQPEDYWIFQARNQIRADYGHEVSISAKAKPLQKFGRRDALGTSFATIWLASPLNEVLPTSNIITHLSSSDAGDTGEVVIEGHTIDAAGSLTFNVQRATLSGQSSVALATPLGRATRVYNDSGTDWAGTIYAHEGGATTGGVPNDAATIHLQGTGAPRNQSEKAQTAVSLVDYWIITEVYGSCSTKTSANVEFEFQVRLKNKVWRTRLPGWTATNSGSSHISLKPYFIVPPNSDVRIIAKSSTTNTEVEAGMSGILAIIV